MTDEDFDLARRRLDALDSLLKQAAGSAPVYDRMLELRRLCQSACEALDDNCCSEQLDFIELYAGDLFSEVRQARERGLPPRIDLLERKIRDCISSIQARLMVLEAVAVAVA